MIVFVLRVSETPPFVGKFQQLDDFEYNMDRNELGGYVKWDAVLSCSASLLHSLNPTFDFGYVLVGTC
jgi:hypothetical protein